MSDQFHSNQLFRDVPPEFMSRIKSVVRKVTCEAGEVVFSEEEVGNIFYLVEEGLIRISKLGRGGQHETMTYVEPGNFFGEMALLDSNPRSARATAIERTVLGAINRDGFQQLLAMGCPQVYMNFLLHVVERLRGVSEHFISEVMRAERLSLVGSMASAIIHDLNNPITVIRACNEMLEIQNSATERAKFVLLTKSAIDQMLAMIHELLDFSRGHAVKLEVQPIAVAQLIQDLDAQILRLLPRKSVELVQEISHHGEVFVDRSRFLRVLANVVKNAMESMPSGGVLTLGIHQEEDGILFFIQDTGGGIPPEIQSRIFEPFVTAGKKHGTGLGMAIAKSVVEAHRGKITLQSEVGVGTKVEIRIPAQARETAGRGVAVNP